MTDTTSCTASTCANASTVAESAASGARWVTTMSAALKALERAGLLAVVRDEKDKRIRRPVLTPKGYETVHAALPIWRAEHAALEREAPPGEAARLRAALTAFAPARAPSTTPSTPDADNRS